MLSPRCVIVAHWATRFNSLNKIVSVAAFRIYLSVVKMPLKGEVGGHALKSHGNYTVDHGKS